MQIVIPTMIIIWIYQLNMGLLEYLGGICVLLNYPNTENQLFIQNLLVEDLEDSDDPGKLFPMLEPIAVV